MDTITSAAEVAVQTDSRPSGKAPGGSLEPATQLFHLCAQIRPTASAAHRLRDLTSELEAPESWQALVQLAVDHRVLSLVSHNLQKLASEKVPQDLLIQLQHQAQRNQRRVFGLTGALIQVMQQLQRQDIAAIPFKGLLLSLEAYGSPHLRQFDDLDLWVSPEDFFLVREVLSGQGYVPCQISLSAELERQFYLQMGEYPLTGKENDVDLDIHNRLMGGDCSMMVDFSRCWDRVEETQVMGHPMLTLQREDLMIYLCANGMKDGWSYLRAVCDVAALMTHETPLDWAFVLSEARSMKALRMVRLGIMLAHRLLEVPMPTEVVELPVDATVQRMCDRIYRRLSSSERPHAEEQAALEKLMLRFLASESLSARGTYLRKVVGRILKVTTHVTFKDRQFLALPERLSFLYYVVRPIRILSEHHSNLFTVSGYRMFR